MSFFSDFSQKKFFIIVIILVFIWSLYISTRMGSYLSADQVLNFVGVLASVFGIAVASYFAWRAIDAFAHVDKFSELKKEFEGKVEVAEAALADITKLRMAQDSQIPNLSQIIIDLLSDLQIFLSSVQLKKLDDNDENPSAELFDMKIKWDDYKLRISRLCAMQEFLIAHDGPTKIDKARAVVQLGDVAEVEIAAQFLKTVDYRHFEPLTRRDANELLEVARRRVRELTSGQRV